MKAKTVLGIGLLVFAAVTVVYMVATEIGGPNQQDAQASGEDPVMQVGAETATSTPHLPPGTDAPVRTAEAATSSEPPDVHQPPQWVVTVYYFHGSRRCRGCRNMEELARTAVLEGFPEEVERGTVRFRDVNFEEAEHRDLVVEHQVSVLSLVVSEAVDGQMKRYKALDRIWELSGDPVQYSMYVQSEVLSYLNGDDE